MSKKVTYKDFQLLKTIPSTGKISATEILKKLQGQGFQLDKRTIQRDLNSLSVFFAIQTDGNKDVAGWSWKPEADKLELPSMSPDVALSLQILKTHLARFTPPNVFTQLQPYFKNANKLLDTLSDNHLSTWQDKIGTLSRVQPLITPNIDIEQMEKIYNAVLLETQINATYAPLGEDPKEYKINPFGIVVVDRALYLVCSLWQYDDIKQFALHRFIEVENTTNKIKKPADFKLQKYIDKGNFLFPENGNDKIELLIKVSQYWADYLHENKLSNNQSIKKDADNSSNLSATVQNTQQLKWWLLSMGSDVEVIQPKALRETMIQNIQTLGEKYN